MAAGWRRFLSYLAYVGGFGKVYPETVSLLVGYRCNLSCPMCGQWGERGSFRAMGKEGIERELTLQDVGSIVTQVRRWKPAVTFFGGEPLMNRDIIAMILSAKEAGLRVNVITNGTLLGKMAAEIVRAGIDEVIVSLDGPEEVHDRMRGRAGTYARVVRGIESVAREKRENGRRKPVVNVNATIWEENHGCLSRLVPLAAGLGASTLTFHHPTFLGGEEWAIHERIMRESYGVCRSDFDGFVREAPPRVSAQRLIEEKRRAEALADGVRVSFYPNFTEDEIRRYYANDRFAHASYAARCLSPWMAAYVFPNGDLGPCLSLGVRFGNIHEEAIEKILGGSAARRFRRDLKERGMFPACARCTELCRF